MIVDGKSISQGLSRWLTGFLLLFDGEVLLKSWLIIRDFPRDLYYFADDHREEVWSAIKLTGRAMLCICLFIALSIATAIDNEEETEGIYT